MKNDILATVALILAVLALVVNLKNSGILP